MSVEYSEITLSYYISYVALGLCHGACFVFFLHVFFYYGRGVFGVLLTLFGELGIGWRLARYKRPHATPVVYAARSTSCDLSIIIIMLG